MQITIDVQDADEADAVRRMLKERRRQDDLFGQQNHDPAWWMVITGEEYGEMCKAVCDYRWAQEVIGKETRQQRIAHAVKEAEQVAACAIAFMQSVLRNEWVDEVTTVIPSDKRQVAKALGVGDEQINYEPKTLTPEQREEIVRVGEESLKRHHPSLWAEMVEEKQISRSDQS